MVSPFPSFTLQASHKGKEDMKSLEKQMLKAHRKDVTSLIKGKKGDMGFLESDLKHIFRIR